MPAAHTQISSHDSSPLQPAALAGPTLAQTQAAQARCGRTAVPARHPPAFCALHRARAATGAVTCGAMAVAACRIAGRNACGRHCAAGAAPSATPVTRTAHAWHRHRLARRAKTAARRRYAGVAAVGYARRSRSFLTHLSPSRRLDSGNGNMAAAAHPVPCAAHPRGVGQCPAQ